MKVLVVSAASQEGHRLVRTLVDEGLIACGNVIPGVTAIYRWRGELCEENEALLWMECSDRLATDALARITELHSYEVPKILVLEPCDALAAYAKWVEDAAGHEKG